MALTSLITASHFAGNTNRKCNSFFPADHTEKSDFPWVGAVISVVYSGGMSTVCAIDVSDLGLYAQFFLAKGREGLILGTYQKRQT